jgi:para-nitrobenzyl esterase
MTQQRPLVQLGNGTVRGVWRGASAAFYGIPFAQPPVGDLRFAAPVPAEPWDGELDASRPGPTPQRRPFAEVTTIPEPSFPGDATLNVNVFSPVPGQPDAKLPVLVWIHGGGFFAGSPSSPWYDGAAYNRDGVVTVSLSYRLGFDGFGWIADAPTNRGVLDMIAGLEWVRDNIAAFGGDPAAVTIAGQSAGGTAVLALLSSPAAQGLFARVIAHSAAGLTRGLAAAESIGREFAATAEVEPTLAGWAGLSEDAILDLQASDMSFASSGVPSPAEALATTLASGGIGLPFVPLIGDEVLPLATVEALATGTGADKDLLIGTVAHEFTMATMPFAEVWAGTDPVAALAEGGLAANVAAAYVAGQPELRSTAQAVGQVGTDLSFRVPTLACADARPERTWMYDFRWVSPVLGMSSHCLELPFTWDCLAEESVAASTGPNPPQELADEMHSAWVRFISTGDPGWPVWDGHNARVFGAQQADHYAVTRLLVQGRRSAAR